MEIILVGLVASLTCQSVYFYFWKWSESESHSVVSYSLQPLGILQVRMLKWVAFPFSRGSSQPRDQTQASHIAGGFFTSWATRVFICGLFIYLFILIVVKKKKTVVILITFKHTLQCVCVCSLSCVRLFATPWTFPGKNTAEGCHFVLQGIFPTWGWNMCLLRLPHWQEYSWPLGHLRSLYIYSSVKYIHIAVQ